MGRQKAVLVAFGVIVGLGLLSFQNCAKHQFSAMEQTLEKAGDRDSGPGITNPAEPSEPQPVCTDFDGVGGALKILLVVDNTKASDAIDPDKRFRHELMLNLVKRSAQKTNFSWSLIEFDDTSARAEVGALADKPQFANVDGALDAIERYRQAEAKGDTAALKPALALVRAAIADDPDYQEHPSDVNYVVLLISGQSPADFGDPTDVSELKTAVQDLLALSPQHIALSTVHFGPERGSSPEVSPASILAQIAHEGSGVFTNFGADLDPASQLAHGDRMALPVLAHVPASICGTTAPNATSTPTPAPVCPSPSREVFGADETKSVACGTDGKKDVTSAVKIIEECAVAGGALVWSEVARTTIVKKEGPCTGQSCRLPDGSLMPDKTSRKFYSSAAPQGRCEEASETRACDNGVLSGSSTFTQMTCRSGCGDFGRDGTVKTGVVAGETSSQVTCPFGETGVNDIYESLVDQTCSDGKIVESNKRQGKKIKAGVCPTYSWNPTDSWGVCSADCGGEQKRVYECRDDKGAVADASRCASVMPTETRVCDGNPSAVVRTESAKTQERAGSTTERCPANQIGVIVQIRDVTTTKTYGCVDHKAAVAKTDVVNGAWATERYCRDYVAHRCSQDSLSNGMAEGRYQWMRKCADEVPVIKRFLTEFADVKVNGNFTISSEGTRHLYPTFMDTATTPEKPWRAPTSPSASCDVPKTAYVAAVCLSSCATPEQEILVAAEAKLERRNMPFIDALTRDAKFVATLQSSSTMSSKDVVNTKVQQWVTEMIDTDHDIVEFHLKSGRSLRLTPNHPVIAEDGSMKLAGGFKVGENLVRLGGELDPIVSIDNVKYHGKVYNLFVESSELLKNIVVTNGYLNGTAFYQNEGASNLNRQLLRKKLTVGVLAK